jgi:hypothetical protein
VAAVTLAVLHGARTVEAVAAAVGWSSKAWTWRVLRDARALGLVAFEPGRQATIRPAVKVTRR